MIGPPSSLSKPVGAIVLALFCNACADFFPAVQAEDQQQTDGEESQGDGDGGDPEEFEAEEGSCDAWKISYCEAIEQCSAFDTAEDCHLDVGYVACRDDAPVARCEQEIQRALENDECEELPTDCRPEEMADRSFVTQVCQDVYEAICEFDFFCGAALSVDTCISSLNANTPCSTYTALLPQGEKCAAAIDRLACGDVLPEECVEVFRY